MGQCSSFSFNSQTPPPPSDPQTPPPPSDDQTPSPPSDPQTPPPPSDDQTPPPPSDDQTPPTPCNWEYDVFLSFSGDTRNGFTDHLYSGLRAREINTFRDSEELRKGESIAPKLLEAIEKSEFAVVVFSPKYAISHWCLDELVHIRKCKQSKGTKVLPVFYHVEPTVVRNQTGEYVDAFDKHNTRFKDNNAKVKNWSEALKEIGAIDGWHVEHDRVGEANVVKEIVDEIFDQVYSSMSTEPNIELVGLDVPISEIESCLELESNNNDVHAVGIWGMGGIGKTTLADEVFKRISNQFDPKRRFKSDMKSLSAFDLVRCLCKSLLGITNVDSIENGIKQLKRGMSQRKVLIFLDDVVDFKKIECLAPDGQFGAGILGAGSRLIITTRDRSSLMRSTDEFENLKVYEVGKLRDKEARQLLCQTAFKNRTPPVEFEALSDIFLQYAGGIPLALKTLAYHLSSVEASVWPEIMHSQDNDRDEQIFKVLQVSFDGLNHTEKNIFLDIACFFYGEDLARVENIFLGYNYAARTSITNLVNKSLVKVESGKLQMHDLLRCLGWHIVREENKKEPGERSRLWVDDNALNYGHRKSWRFVDARDVLMDNLGTKHVKGLLLNLHEREEMELEEDTFLKFQGLRLLKLYNVDCEGDHLEHVPKNLLLLEWHKYPLQSLHVNFNLAKLVEIKMNQSHIERLWTDELSLEMLTLMDLSHCQSLAMIPAFTTVPNLERLILQDCNELTELHHTIWNHQKLKFLDLKGCTSLVSLPEYISLSSLETFILSGCSNLQNFPKIGEKMDTLSELYLDGTSIKELHVSMQRLKGLVLLNLSGCRNLISLPSILCGSLTSLRFLYLSLCSNMDNLPDNIGCLESLEKLDACKTAIREVPNSIFELKSLKLLCFHGCPVITSLEYKLRGLNLSGRVINCGGLNGGI